MSSAPRLPRRATATPVASLPRAIAAKKTVTPPADQRESRDPDPEEAQHANQERLVAQAVGGPAQEGHRRYRRGGPREQRDPQRTRGEAQHQAQVCQEHRVAAGPQPEDPEGPEQEHQEGHPAPHVPAPFAIILPSTRET
jgi:hypothetical protein